MRAKLLKHNEGHWPISSVDWQHTPNGLQNTDKVHPKFTVKLILPTESI